MNRINEVRDKIAPNYQKEKVKLAKEILIELRRIRRALEK